MSTPIRISVYDYRGRSSDNYLGHIDTTLEELIAEGETGIDILDETRRDFNGIFTAKLLSNCELPRLFDLRLLGVQISAMIAIDFSASTMGLSFSNLGQHHETGVFSYRYAINDVCDLLSPLTMGQPYSAYAFAEFPQGERLRSLVTNRESDAISNAGALLRSYETIRRGTKFPKRVALAPVFEHARLAARKKWDDERTITILCVVTNGVFTDLNDAIDALVDAEEDPLCVVLVVMGGTRRELERPFRHKHGILESSRGKVTTRRVLKMVTYLEDRVYPDPRLPKRLMPSAKAMARNWLEHVDFYERARSRMRRESSKDGDSPELVERDA